MPLEGQNGTATTTYTQKTFTNGKGQSGMYGLSTLIRNTGGTNNLLVSANGTDAIVTLTPWQGLEIDGMEDGFYVASNTSTTTYECILRYGVRGEN